VRGHIFVVCSSLGQPKTEISAIVAVQVALQQIEQNNNLLGG
jgi:hypothetical protein